MPHAIMFSKDTSQLISLLLAYLATAIIIGLGPQVYICSKSTLLNIECWVTYPFRHDYRLLL